MNNDDDNLIISFKKPSNRTNIDLREKLCLHAKEIFEFRQLTCCIDNEEELQLIVVALMLILHHIKEDADEHCPTHAAVLPMLPTLPAMPTLPTMDSLGPRVQFPAMDAMREKIGLPPFRFGSIWSGSDSSISDLDPSTGGGSSSDSFSSSDSSDADSDSSSSSDSSDSDSDSDSDSSMPSASSSSKFNFKASYSFVTEFESLRMSSIDDSILLSTESNNYANIISLFATILGCSLLDVDLFIQKIIDITAIRKIDMDQIESSMNSPKINRTIDDLGSNCFPNTRFKEVELREMKDLFFGQFPTESFQYKTCRFTYEEVMLISLHYMAHGIPFQQMKSTYGGDWTRYSYMVQWFAKFIHHKYYHRLSGRSMEYWAGVHDINELRQKIFEYVCFDANGDKLPDLDHIELQYFRVYGWIDCMMLVCCTPGSGPIDQEGNRRHDAYEIQRAFFTNYGHQWGMKNQGVFLPNGMLASIYTASIAQNDKGLVNISGIAEELERVMQDWVLPNNVLPAIYGDDIYDICTTIVKRLRNVDALFHDRMTKARIDIEHEFGLIANLFKRLNVKHTWKLMSLGKLVHAHYFSIFFMVNAYTCLRENKTSVKYKVTSHTLQEYLDVSRDDWYDGNDADLDMINHLNTQE